LACGYNLAIWKIRDTNTCLNDVDTIEHHLILPPETKTFWQQFLNWWQSTMNVIFRLDTYDLLFGVPNEEKDITINQFNFMILMARHHIYNMAMTQQSKAFEKKWCELHDAL
jgi:hypothetical protein